MHEIINFDGKNMTPAEMKEEIHMLNESLYEGKCEENYQKFYIFCNKLEAGGH